MTAPIRVRAAQLHERAAARLAYGGRRHAPSHARTGQYRRCASCRWVFSAEVFRIDRRRLGADCALCRAERRAVRERRGVAA